VRIEPGRYRGEQLGAVERGAFDAESIVLGTGQYDVGVDLPKGHTG
jgi:hypothetical protein